MTSLALYSIKGGVGKTAAAVNLAYLSALEGARTLLWDLDPQAAATFTFRVRPRVKGGGRRLVKAKKKVGRAVKGTDYHNLDLLPADFSYRHLDLLLNASKRPTRRLLRILKPLAAHYDRLILDCPPGITLLSEAVFETVEMLLVPVIPTTLSLRTLTQLKTFREEKGIEHLRVLPFFSMVDRRKALHRQVSDSPPAECDGMLSTSIPFASEVEKMALLREPLPCYAPRSRAAASFASLWREIREATRQPSAGGGEWEEK